MCLTRIKYCPLARIRVFFPIYFYHRYRCCVLLLFSELPIYSAYNNTTSKLISPCTFHSISRMLNFCHPYTTISNQKKKNNHPLKMYIRIEYDAIRFSFLYMYTQLFHPSKNNIFLIPKLSNFSLEFYSERVTRIIYSRRSLVRSVGIKEEEVNENMLKKNKWMYFMYKRKGFQCFKLLRQEKM